MELNARFLLLYSDYIELFLAEGDPIAIPNSLSLSGNKTFFMNVDSQSTFLWTSEIIVENEPNQFQTKRSARS